MANDIVGTYKYNDVMRALENAEASENYEDAAELAKIANTLYTQGQAPKSYTWGEVPVNALLNFIPNAGEFVINTVKAGLSPIDTLNQFSDLTTAVSSDVIRNTSPKLYEQLKSIDTSIYEKFPNVYKTVMGGKTPEEFYKGNEQLADDLFSAAKENLGTEEGIKRTLAERPFDVLTAISPKTGMSALEYGGKALKYGGTKTLDATKWTSEKLMQSALKPDKKQRDTGQAKIAATVMLENDIPVSSSGVKILKDKVDDLNEKITSTVSGSEIPVNKSQVLSVFSDLRKKYSKQGLPKKDLDAINAAEQEFIKSHPDILTAEDASRIKSGTYQAIGERAYGEEKSINVEIQKAIARGLKEQVEKVDINVKPLNAEQQKLLQTLKVLEPRVLAEGNKDVIGIAQANPNPSSITSVFLEKAFPKSLIAKYLYRGQNFLRDPAKGLNTSFTSLLGDTRANQISSYLKPAAEVYGSVLTQPSTQRIIGTGGLLAPDERYTNINFMTDQYPR